MAVMNIFIRLGVGRLSFYPKHKCMRRSKIFPATLSLRIQRLDEALADAEQNASYRVCRGRDRTDQRTYLRSTISARSLWCLGYLAKHFIYRIWSWVAPMAATLRENGSLKVGENDCRRRKYPPPRSRGFAGLTEIPQAIFIPLRVTR